MTTFGIDIMRNGLMEYGKQLLDADPELMKLFEQQLGVPFGPIQRILFLDANSRVVAPDDRARSGLLVLLCDGREYRLDRDAVEVKLRYARLSGALSVLDGLDDFPSTKEG